MWKNAGSTETVSKGKETSTSIIHHHLPNHRSGSVVRNTIFTLLQLRYIIIIHPTSRFCLKRKWQSQGRRFVRSRQCISFQCVYTTDKAVFPVSSLFNDSTLNILVWLLILAVCEITEGSDTIHLLFCWVDKKENKIVIVLYFSPSFPQKKFFFLALVWSLPPKLLYRVTLQII